MATSPHRSKHVDDLTGVDLSKIRVSEFDLDPDESTGTIGRWFWLVVTVGLGIGLIWFPQSEFYLAIGKNHGFLFGLIAVAAFVGLVGFRVLWGWLEDMAANAAKRRARENVLEIEKPVPGWQRGLLLLVALAGMIGILIWLPQSGWLQGDSFSWVWYVVVVAAIIVGLLLGQWLMLQAKAYVPTEPMVRVKLPPWFRWVSLAVLLLGVVILIVFQLSNLAETSEPVRFTLTALGLVVGIGVAIWVARRFDEAEEKIKKKLSD